MDPSISTISAPVPYPTSVACWMRPRLNPFVKFVVVHIDPAKRQRPSEQLRVISPRPGLHKGCHSFGRCRRNPVTASGNHSRCPTHSLLDSRRLVNISHRRQFVPGTSAVPPPLAPTASPLPQPAVPAPAAGRHPPSHHGTPRGDSAPPCATDHGHESTARCCRMA